MPSCPTQNGVDSSGFARKRKPFLIIILALHRKDRSDSSYLNPAETTLRTATPTRFAAGTSLPEKTAICRSLGGSASAKETWRRIGIRHRNRAGIRSSNEMNCKPLITFLLSYPLSPRPHRAPSKPHPARGPHQSGATRIQAAATGAEARAAGDSPRRQPAMASGQCPRSMRAP